MGSGLKLNVAEVRRPDFISWRRRGRQTGKGPGAKSSGPLSLVCTTGRAGTRSGAGRYTPVRKPCAITKQGANSMLAGLAALLVILWLLGFLAFHVAGGLIH